MSGSSTRYQRNRLLRALQAAYRKHHMGDESIGWDELSDTMCDALCEAMGDGQFQRWIREQGERINAQTR